MSTSIYDQTQHCCGQCGTMWSSIEFHAVTCCGVEIFYRNPITDVVKLESLEKFIPKGDSDE